LQRSALARIGFPVFAWGLAFHSLVIAALFGWFGLPQGVVRAIAGWKDLGLLLLLLVVVIRSLTGRGAAVSLAWTDLWVGGLFALATVYLAGENLWLRANVPLFAELLGIRRATLFMLIYFVGRAMPELADDDGVLRSLYLLVIVTCIIGVLERFLVPPEALVALGVAAYFQDFLGASAMTVGNEFGLPTNYWVGIGGRLVRRAGSIYLGGQGFAIPFLLFFPLVTVLVLSRRNRSNWLLVGYALICFALGLTLTRMTIIVAVIQLVLFVVMRRRPEWAVAGLAIGVTLFFGAMVGVPGFPTFVLNTLAGNEASTAGHVSDWTNGAAAFFERPWGSGLGTSDLTAERAGLKHITGDNLYLTYAVEMGFFGVSLLILVLGSIMGHAFHLVRNGATECQKRMGTTLWLASLGIMINGLTAVVFNSITLGWLFFWLAGAVVTNSQRVRSPVLAMRTPEPSVA